MNANTLIVTIYVWVLSINAPLAPGMLPVVPSGSPKITAIVGSSFGEQQVIELAENEAVSPVDKTEKEAGSESEISAPRSGTETGRSGQSTQTKAKPLEPFVPSEEIPAEQAVDFPVDI